MPGQRKYRCVRCGEDLFASSSFQDIGATAQNSEEMLHCRACRMAPPAFVRAVSAGVYEGSLRGAIHAFKYERITALARPLGVRLAAAMAGLADGPKDVLVVPVPLHSGRMRERGFNQARALATEALRVLAKTHPEWKMELSARTLVRQRSTESQSGLSARQRRVNLRGAFFVSDARAVKGRHILLVDDILTTGATARACSWMLVEAGAASVRVATLARAQRRGPRRSSEFDDGSPGFAGTAQTAGTVH